MSPPPASREALFASIEPHRPWLASGPGGEGSIQGSLCGTVWMPGTRGDWKACR